MNRGPVAAAGAIAALMAAHAAPTLALVGPIGGRFVPRLVGIGRPGHVALTFDDGPDPASTPLVLDALEAADCQATFFLLGSMTAAAPTVARRILQRGHEIGVHGDQHRSTLSRTRSALRRDLTTATATIREATGQQPVWFRPPYGHLSATTLQTARSLNLRTILWTAWGRDWRARATPTSIIADIERGTVDGGTILLHDSDCTSAPGSWRNTADALPLLIAKLRAQGLQPGPLRDHWPTAEPPSTETTEPAPIGSRRARARAH